MEMTQIPAGTGIAMSVRARRRCLLTRMGMLIQFNPWGDAEWSQNYFTWRCEERSSLTVPRPAALNIITGLPTS